MLCLSLALALLLANPPKSNDKPEPKQGGVLTGETLYEEATADGPKEEKAEAMDPEEEKPEEEEEEKEEGDSTLYCICKEVCLLCSHC